jgi:hypothetical protein
LLQKVVWRLLPNRDSVAVTRLFTRSGDSMMRRLNLDRGQLFYCFKLEKGVPGDHQVRRIAEVLDLSTGRGELARHYSFCFSILFCFSASAD